MMPALKKQLKVLADRIDAMSVRERGLVFFGGVVVLYLIASEVVFGPLRVEQVRHENALRDKREQIQSADRQIATLLSPEGSGVTAGNKVKVAALERQLKELDAHMDQMTSGVVTPKEMAKLLEQMLARNKGLELVKLEALPATPVGDETRPAGVPALSDVIVYRHGMRVEFKGRYFDIVEYLKALEGLPWKVFWGEVSLETDKYPVSKVSLVIYTLSRHSGWIGV